MITFYITLAVSVGLTVGGFLVPPVGVIDGSVLTGVGLLLMFALVAQVPDIVKAAREGRSIKLTKGDFSAEVSGPPAGAPDS